MSDIVPRSQMTKQGVKGISAVGGGIALLVLASTSWFGIIAGAALTVIGVAIGRSKSDRVAGIVTTVVGVASLLTGLLARSVPALKFLMWGPGIILIAGGIWSLVRFFQNLRKRM